jgi:hypothetical protein
VEDCSVVQRRGRWLIRITLFGLVGRCAGQEEERRQGGLSV